MLFYFASKTCVGFYKSACVIDLGNTHHICADILHT